MATTTIAVAVCIAWLALFETAGAWVYQYPNGYRPAHVRQSKQYLSEANNILYHRTNTHTPLHQHDDTTTSKQVYIRYHSITRRLHSTPSSDSDSSESKHDPVVPLLRTQFAGVSLSPTGFWVLLQCSAGMLPISVTNDVRDSVQATSPQALTLLQLLATPAPVDMAGPVFPAETLTKLVLLQADADNNIPAETIPVPTNTALMQTQHPIIDYLQTNVLLQLGQLNCTGSYSQQHQWIQSRISLPACTLDEVQLQITEHGELQWTLMVQTVNVQGKSLSINPSPQVIQQLCWKESDDDDNDDQPVVDAKVAMAFTCLALALRYKAPIVLTLQDTMDTSIFLQDVSEQFPLFKSRVELSQTTSRVHDNIERGFQVNKLQSALRIALSKGDKEAADKIRLKLDEMDSLKDLPVQAENDLESMQ
jgi:hypothetical protein